MSSRRFKITVGAAILVASILVILSQKFMGELAPLLGVINLLGTLVHEGGHSIATLLTDGSLSGVVVMPDGSGYALLAGGNQSLVLPAGYLSSTLIMALVFLVNNRTRWGDVLPLLMGVVYIGITIVFGDDLAGGAVTKFVGLIGGGLLVVVGLHFDIPIPWTGKKVVFHDFAWMTINNTIAIYYGLAGILSLSYISYHAEHGNTDDVSRYTDMFFRSTDPKFMAAIWMLVSIAVWLIVIYIVVRHLFRREQRPIQ